MDEVWRPTKFDGYEVSNLGRVRTPKRVLVNRLGCSSRGFRYRVAWVKAADKWKNALVHHLVAEAFIGPRPPGRHVAHLDGDRENNRPENLAYCTPTENAAHKILHGTAGRRKGEGKVRPPKKRPSTITLTEADIRHLWDLRRGGVRPSIIAAKLRTSRANVSAILHGRRWVRLQPS